MSNRTVLNTSYKGLVESVAIPAELHERDGKQYASFGSTVPIHCCSPEQVSERDGKQYANFGFTVPIHGCTPEQVKELANTTHHYCDMFTEQVLAPLGELVYVRIDDSTAEKVFINRNKRILLISSDGVLAQWRCAPTFESANLYVAGTPIVNKDGELVSVVTARKGNHYAVSTFEGEGGYFDTTEPWKILETPEGASVYGDKTFASRDEIRQYTKSLPPIQVLASEPPTPMLHQGQVPRIVLVAKNGRQISHQYLHGVITSNIEYL